MKLRKRNEVFFQDASNLYYQGHTELESSESGLKKYTNAIVENLLADYTNEFNHEAIIDFGAGTGQLAEIVRAKTNTSPICIEIDSHLNSKLNERGFKTAASISDQEVPAAKLVYSSNVLEHINDDVSCLRDIYQKVLPGGRISIFVPALPFLYSDFDHQVGHFRRYRKKELLAKVKSVGFEVMSVKYFDSVGIITWLLMKIVGVRPNSQRGVSILMSLYDNVIFPISRTIDFLGMSRIAGKNIILIARKRES